MIMYIKEFLEWKSLHAPRAAVNYKPILEAFERFSGGDVSDDLLFSYQKYCTGQYQAVTMNIVTSALRQYAMFLKGKGLTINPYMIRHVRFVAKDRVYATQSDVDRMILCMDEDSFFGLQKIIAIRLMWETGVRVSELVALNISDIDLQNKTAHIVSKKSFKKRYITWGSETHSLLIKFLGVRISENQRDHLFMVEKRRTRPTVRTIQKWVKTACEDADITKAITPHSFRHGKAHNMIRRGAGVKDIQVVLGHSETNPQAAFQYLRLDEQEEKRILDKYVDA